MDFLLVKYLLIIILNTNLLICHIVVNAIISVATDKAFMDNTWK
jgi:hypothetical protein